MKYKYQQKVYGGRGRPEKHGESLPIHFISLTEERGFILVSAIFIGENTFVLVAIPVPIKRVEKKNNAHTYKHTYKQ